MSDTELIQQTIDKIRGAGSQGSLRMAAQALADQWKDVDADVSKELHDLATRAWRTPWGQIGPFVEELAQKLEERRAGG